MYWELSVPLVSILLKNRISAPYNYVRVQPPELVLGPLERRLHVLWLRHVDRHEDATVALCKDLENNT